MLTYLPVEEYFGRIARPLKPREAKISQEHAQTAERGETTDAAIDRRENGLEFVAKLKTLRNR